MTRLRQRMLRTLATLGPRYMPFADVATPDLPLGRLLRLSLFQVSCGMTLVLLVGTLNRVMIVELEVAATLVAVMVALPVVFAPFRALIGFRSDTHRCELGWRRVPFIWNGTLLQFGGFAIMPFAILVLAGALHSANYPAWIGQSAAALAFLLVGAGVHTVQTAGLALATDLTPQESHPRVVGFMYVMLLAGMVGSALLFGWLLSDFTPGRLIQVVQGAAVLVVVLNVAAMWKQETRRPGRGRTPASPDPTFREAWAVFAAGEGTLRRLAIVGLGTMAFAMSDIVLEPFGGQVLGLAVASTTKLTALVALGGLIGFTLASRVLAGGFDPYRMAQIGALVGLAAFALVVGSAPLGQPPLYVAGNFLIGLGAALFGHGTLTATMSRAPKAQIGLALGAWGAVQATAAGIATMASGTLRDLAGTALAAVPGPWGLPSAVNGYLAVYALEIVLLLVTIVASVALVGRVSRPAGAFAAAEPGGTAAR